MARRPEHRNQRHGPVAAFDGLTPARSWQAATACGRLAQGNPFHSYVLLTRPLTAEEWTRVGWRRRQGIADRRNFLHYPRPSADGRVLWGGRDAAYQSSRSSPSFGASRFPSRPFSSGIRWSVKIPSGAGHARLMASVSSSAT
jgi:hypothetical protein